MNVLPNSPKEERVIAVIKQYDVVKLKDGRRAVIVEVLEQGVAYIADVGDCPETWETIDVSHENIVSIFEEVERSIRTA